MQNYVKALVDIKSKANGTVIETICDDGTGFFAIVKQLKDEGLINGRYIPIDQGSCFSDVSITIKGAQLIEKLHKDNEPWYKKVIRWENFERCMKTVNFSIGIIIFIIGFLSGKFIS